MSQIKPIVERIQCAVKKHYMQQGPRVKKFPIAIQFLGTYVIVMGVSNLPGNFLLDC